MKLPVLDASLKKKQEIKKDSLLNKFIDLENILKTPKKELGYPFIAFIGGCNISK